MIDLVKSCLYNWLGYGNVNGELWFIGGSLRQSEFLTVVSAWDKVNKSSEFEIKNGLFLVPSPPLKVYVLCSSIAKTGTIAAIMTITKIILTTAF